MEGFLCFCEEKRFKQKVFGRIARKGHFRKENQIGPFLAGVSTEGEDSGRVSRQVPHSGVELGESEAKSSRLPQIFGQENGFSDFFHGFPTVHALFLDFTERLRVRRDRAFS
jgi:hypothetical protein